MTVLDMTGKPCPMPVIETRKALKTAKPGDIVSVLVDNDIARENLQKTARWLGHAFSHENQADGCILISITVADGCAIIEDESAGLVVAIGRDCMGGGSEELGKSLMKSFIFSLTELETPPEHILFFNGGVLLSTEGATTLDDLAALAAKGTQISSCGACLNYYKLADKLAVGQVTNMYAIMSTMAQAKKLINL
ncbi:MAG: sulfurtransferase-like selenium metabolism protein YedF [Deltaproteobacteria bacterium]|jgi:selenium metabolism protein YedF|nr:sulfurtransferase-like selenium metabolism protein YedF [Deltaproteobacteria bacterium]